MAPEEAIILKRRAAPAVAPVAQVLRKQDEQAEAEAAARRRAAAKAKARAAASSSEEEQEQGRKDEKQMDTGRHAVGSAMRKVLGNGKDRGDDDDDDNDSSSGGGSDDSSSSGSSGSSSSSSDYESHVPAIRPVFVSKDARATVKDAAQLELEQEDEERRAAEEAAKRKLESKALVAERVAEAKMAALASKEQEKEFVPVNVDDVDETEEYEKWRVRELTRMKREREERQMWAQQRAEIERRRKMDDAEILAEDGDRSKGEKSKLKFLQRYYHKGAFYQDELNDEFGDVDFNAPTGLDADIADKSLLPEVMQVRSKWALRGRTKYTHLTDQDTTFAGGMSDERRFGELPEEARLRLEKKRGGVGDVKLPTEKRSKH